MIIETESKTSNVFSTMTSFKREYKILKENLKEQLHINRLPKLQNIFLLRGELLHNGVFLNITKGTKENMMQYIKDHKNINFKLVLLPCTIRKK
ncbi:MAG: hypothetical protein LIR50_19700 [Bacillota bacterium]|nr:hypothetical protein [Bacillota bacterium]